MTPEDFHLITKEPVSIRDEGDGDEYVTFDDIYFSSFPVPRRVISGEIEQQEFRLRSVNIAYGLDSVKCKNGTLKVEPRPQFETWQEYLTSLRLSRQVSDLQTGGQ